MIKPKSKKSVSVNKTLTPSSIMQNMPKDKLFEVGVSKRLSKRSSAKHKDVPIGITKSEGQSKNGVLKYRSERGNPLGRVAGTVNGTMTSVSFGDNRTEEEALCQLMEYIKAQLAPPQVYFDLELGELISFDDKDSFVKYKKECERLPPLICVASGTKRDGVWKLLTLTGEHIGLFRVNTKDDKHRFRYGKLTSIIEAATAIVEQLRLDQIPLAAYMLEGTCVEFCPASKSEALSAINELSRIAIRDHHRLMESL